MKKKDLTSKESFCIIIKHDGHNITDFKCKKCMSCDRFVCYRQCDKPSYSPEEIKET